MGLKWKAREKRCHSEAWQGLLGTTPNSGAHLRTRRLRGVNEALRTVVRKERRLALAGRAKERAEEVRTKAPLPTWPDPDPDPDPIRLLGWLHDSRERTITRTEKEQKFLKSRPVEPVQNWLAKRSHAGLPALPGSVTFASYS